MHRLNLIEVDGSMHRALEHFVQEFIAAGEILYGAPELTDGMTVKEWLEYLELHKDKDRLPSGRVLAHTFILKHPSNHEIVGLINLRLELNEYLLAYGGHIGYAVAPKHRAKGFGSAMLRALVPIASQFGLGRLLITCADDNVASMHTIESCCGHLEDIRSDLQGRLIRRYWLTGLEC